MKKITALHNLKKHWLLLITLVSCNTGFSQNVNVEEENSHKHKYFIFINPVYAEMSTGELFRVNADVKLLVNPLSRLWGDFTFQQAFLGSNKGKFTAEQPYKSFQNFELGARFSLLDRIKNRRHKIMLGGYTTSTHTVTKYVIVKIPVRRVFAVRGGLYANRQHASTQWGLVKTGDKPQVRTNDGILIGGGWDPLFTTTRAQGISAGFSFISIANTSYNFNVEGRNRTFESCFLRDLTFDVMYQLHTSMDDFISGGKSHTVELGKDDTFNMRNIGLKMGFSHLTTYKKVGLSLGIDAGFRPGIPQSSLFFGCKVGVSFAK